MIPLPVLLPGTRHWWDSRASVGLDPTASHIFSWLRVHCSLTRHIASSWPPLLAAVWYCLTDGPRVMNCEVSNELSRNGALSLGQERFMFAARVLTDSLFTASWRYSSVRPKAFSYSYVRTYWIVSDVLKTNKYICNFIYVGLLVLYCGHQHVSVTHVPIFRMISVRTKI